MVRLEITVELSASQRPTVDAARPRRCTLCCETGSTRARAEQAGGGGYIRVKRTQKSSYKNMYFI